MTGLETQTEDITTQTQQDQEDSGLESYLPEPMTRPNITRWLLFNEKDMTSGSVGSAESPGTQLTRPEGNRVNKEIPEG
jgi:hypothetical protein